METVLRIGVVCSTVQVGWVGRRGKLYLESVSYPVLYKWGGWVGGGNCT